VRKHAAQDPYELPADCVADEQLYTSVLVTIYIYVVVGRLFLKRIVRRKASFFCVCFVFSVVQISSPSILLSRPVSAVLTTEVADTHVSSGVPLHYRVPA